MWIVWNVILNFVWCLNSVLYVCEVCVSYNYVCIFVFDTYYVPTTLLVLSWIWSPLNIRATPKFEILEFISASSRTLVVLRSLWMILNLESWWRYKSPRATPQIISKRFPQSNNDLFVLSEWRNENFKYICFCIFATY